ncbi:MAG TPA: GNAT family N-acetyltransferase, partial [Alphaproteobacteria bacterium]|nr:GNAT family N-acetyltransferase [Alphaproteobacteria bacterium]
MQPAMDIPANELAGRVVRLEIITEAHREGLRKAAADPKIWQFLP